MYEQEEEMMKLAAEMSLRESESSDPLGMIIVFYIATVYVKLSVDM